MVIAISIFDLMTLNIALRCEIICIKSKLCQPYSFSAFGIKISCHEWLEWLNDRRRALWCGSWTCQSCANAMYGRPMSVQYTWTFALSIVQYLLFICYRYIRLLDQVIDYQMNTIGHIDASMVTFTAASFVRHSDKADSALATVNRCRTPSVASSCSSLCDADSCIDDFLSWKYTSFNEKNEQT